MQEIGGTEGMGILLGSEWFKQVAVGVALDEVKMLCYAMLCYAMLCYDTAQRFDWLLLLVLFLVLFLLLSLKCSAVLVSHTTTHI